MATYAQIASAGKTVEVAVCLGAPTRLETDIIQKICGSERSSRRSLSAISGLATAGGTRRRSSHYKVFHRESKIFINNVFVRRESQGGSAMICFGRAPVKFRQPPRMCERLRLNEACEVTSFSAGFFIFEVDIHVQEEIRLPMRVRSGNAATLFLPAAGNRNNNSSALNNAGTNGNYWSSSVNGTNAYNLNFNSGTVNPGNNNNRANGFSLRCVAALNLVFGFRGDLPLTPSEGGGVAHAPATGGVWGWEGVTCNL